MNEVHELIIVGSGPAGLTAAIYAARANLKPLVLAGYKPGGQLMDTSIVENFPGFIEGIQGPELMGNMISQAQKWGSELVYQDANFVDFGGEIKVVKTPEGEYKAKAVILASGALPRRLDVVGEDKYWGFGVSSCATCDGALYRGKVVAVIGGGDSAMEEANFLSTFAIKVYVLNRGEAFKASPIMLDRVRNNPKVEIVLNTQVKEVLGDGQKVTGLSLVNKQSEQTSELLVDGMFLAIGHIPVSGFLNGISLTTLGYVESQDGVHTNIEGVFVAGDLEDHKYRQAITSAGAGCKAAMTAQKWLEAKKLSPNLI